MERYEASSYKSFLTLIIESMIGVEYCVEVVVLKHVLLTLDQPFYTYKHRHSVIYAIRMSAPNVEEFVRGLPFVRGDSCGFV